MQNVPSVLNEATEQCYAESESAVREVLGRMKREGKITNFCRTSRFREINFVVTGAQGNKIQFQVVSSFAEAKEHSKIFPGVPVIIADAKNSGITERRIKSLIYQT